MSAYAVSGILLLAFIAGLAAAWFLFVRPAKRQVSSLEAQGFEFAQERGRLIERSSRVDELFDLNEKSKLAIASLSKEISSLREQLAETKAELNAERESRGLLDRRLREAQENQDRLQVSLNMIGIEKATLESRLTAEVEKAEEKIKLLQGAREQLSKEFEILANRILEEKSKKFTDQNAEKIGTILNPLREKIVEFQNKVETAYHTESKDRVALGEQVRQLMELNQSLSQDAKNLTSALRGSSKTQGTWGELVLDRILEASGLRKGEEYLVQTSYQNESGGRAQPDVTVNLPEQRHLVIDSKVSLIHYEKFASSEDDEASRQAALAQHLDSIKKHIKDLSSKNYQDLYQLKTLDFVLMFIPIESAFMAAITHDRSLFMDGWNKNVLLVSPSTLLFVLRTVSHLWRQEAQSRNAKEIAKRGAELYDRLRGFLEDLDQIGNRLNQASDSFKDARKKLAEGKGNVIRQAEMLRELGVKPNKLIPSSFSQDADMHEGIDDRANEAPLLLDQDSGED